MEEWKLIEGTNCCYISNYGNVKREAYLIIKANGKEHYLPAKNMNKYSTKDGYLFTPVKIGKRHKTCLIHRLVGKAFIENPLNKPNINHKDGVRTNNHVSNLEWCTQSENVRYSIDVLGYKISDETKQKMSKSTMGRKNSKDRIEKTRLAHLRGKSPHALPIIDTSTGKTYDCIKSYSDESGINYRTILSRMRSNNNYHIKKTLTA